MKPEAGGVSSSGRWAAAARVWGSAVTLLIAGLASARLAPTELGVFLLLSGLVAIIALAELGIPNSVVTPVAAAIHRGDLAEAQVYVAAASRALRSTAGLIGLLGAAMTAVVIIGFGGQPFPPDVSQSTVVAIMLTTTGCIAASAPAGLPYRVLMASGHAKVAAQCALGAQSILLVVAALTWALDAPIAVFLAASLSSAALTGALCELTVRRLQPALRFRLRSPQPRVNLTRRSATFFGIGVAGFVAFEIDSFVIAAALGAAAVPEFAIPSRIFLTVPALAAVYLAPVWPVVADAAQRVDRVALVRAFRGARLQAAAFGVTASGLLALLIGPLMSVLTPSVPDPGLDLVAALAGVAFIHTVSVPYAMMLSGLDLISVQLVSASLMAAANIVLSLPLAYSIGLPGPAIATVFCQVVFTLLPMGVLISRRLTS